MEQFRKVRFQKFILSYSLCLTCVFILVALFFILNIKIDVPMRLQGYYVSVEGALLTETGLLIPLDELGQSVVTEQEIHSLFIPYYVSIITRTTLIAFAVSLILSFVFAYILTCKIIKPIEETAADLKNNKAKTDGKINMHGKASALQVTFPKELSDIEAAFWEVKAEMAGLYGDFENLSSFISHEQKNSLALLRALLQNEGFAARGRSAQKEGFAARGRSAQKEGFAARGWSAQKEGFAARGRSAQKEGFAAREQAVQNTGAAAGERIIAQIDSMVKSLDNILTLSLNESKPEKVDLLLVCGMAVDEYKRVYPDISFDFDEEPALYIAGYELPVYRAVSNLIDNAVKYGRGKPVRVYVGAQRGCPYVSVEDFGVGINMEQQEKIFESRYRIGSRKKDGYGIGLSLVRHVAELCGGFVWVDSRENQGSKFKLVFPAFTLD